MAGKPAPDDSPKRRKEDNNMNKKIMATFAISLFALGMVGFAYSAWWDRVIIEGTVEMGELIIGWLPEFDILETTNGWPEDEPGHGFEPKPWVANSYVSFWDPETGTHHDPPVTVYKEMYIEVYNAYPQYDVHLDAWIKNAGTIPACIYPDFILYFYDLVDDEELGFEVYDRGFDGQMHWIEGAIVDPVDGPIINFEIRFWIPFPDWQLDPCNDYKVEIDIDFKQEAEECHHYIFTVKMGAIQWNKLHEAPDYFP